MKRVLCVLLTIALLMSVGSVALADDTNGTIPVTVRYYSGHDDLTHDFETCYDYSDDCFSESSYIYRQDLAEASLGMAFGAFSSRDAEVQVNEDQNWISIMNQCGFSAPVSNEWYRQVPQHNSIGVCCANKAVTYGGEDYTLIAVGIRGNYYRHEWGGNMNVGESGDHAGWVLCRDQVLDFVKGYIDEYNISGNVKLWIAGYSRSAATANLTAAKLDEGYSLSDNIILTPDNIYCYCFETPLPTVDTNARAAVYGNIQNVVNENDVVTCVPFDTWGFTRYGVDRYVPTDGDSDYETLRDAMLEDFNTIPNNGGSYMVDDFRFMRYDKQTLKFVEDYSVSQSEYYVMLADAMATDFAYSREDYVNNLQSYLIEILGIIFNRNNLDFGGAVSLFCEKLSANYEEIMDSATAIGGDKYLSTYMLIEGLLFDSLNEADITNFRSSEVYNALAVLMSRLTNMAIKDPEVTATLLANATTIISAHYAELSMAWARTLPTNYMTDKQETVIPGIDDKTEETTGDAQDIPDGEDTGAQGEGQKPADDPAPSSDDDGDKDDGGSSVITKVITTVKATVTNIWSSILRLFK